ncbi:MAG: hypothetical protein ACI9FR_000339 [Cryomorphaceae bacterium]|jgi:hypothetical protein
MLNSLTIFLAFIIFLLFGYASLLRLLTKREFGSLSAQALFSGIRDVRVLSSLGSSAFFVSMPATSLLLFWGWAPALLWLVIFHLLVESLFQLQYTTTEQDYSLAELLVRTGEPRTALLESLLVQSFFILLMSTVVALLATLVDKQSGLLFALIALFPAQQLLRGANLSVPLLVKSLSAAAVLSIGVLLAHKLGFGIYGDWPLLGGVFGESMSWLRINNQTFMAGTLVIVSFLLAEKTAFQKDVATLAGGFIVLLIVVMTARLIWLRPLMDAPLNAVQSGASEIPMFISLCLFSFAGLGALLIRLLNDETNYDDANTSAACFGRLQSESFVQLIFIMVLVLILATALGIGSWKTHYLEWSSTASFIDHLNLAISSTLQLVHGSLKNGTFAHTMIMVGMCIAGVSFLMMCVSRFKITRHNKGEDTSLRDVLMSNKIPQSIVIFLLSCYFVDRGVSISVWLLVGALSWSLIVHLMLGITRDMQEASMARSIYGAVCIGLIVLGVVQITWLALHWFSQGQYVLLTAGLLILMIGLILWWKSVWTVVARFSQGANKTLFEDE